MMVYIIINNVGHRKYTYKYSSHAYGNIKNSLRRIIIIIKKILIIIGTHRYFFRRGPLASSFHKIIKKMSDIKSK